MDCMEEETLEDRKLEKPSQFMMHATQSNDLNQIMRISTSHRKIPLDTNQFFKRN